MACVNYRQTQQGFKITFAIKAPSTRAAAGFGLVVLIVTAMPDGHLGIRRTKPVIEVSSAMFRTEWNSITHARFAIALIHFILKPSRTRKTSEGAAMLRKLIA